MEYCKYQFPSAYSRNNVKIMQNEILKTYKCFHGVCSNFYTLCSVKLTGLGRIPSTVWFPAASSAANSP